MHFDKIQVLTVYCSACMSVDELIERVVFRDPDDPHKKTVVFPSLSALSMASAMSNFANVAVVRRVLSLGVASRSQNGALNGFRVRV